MKSSNRFLCMVSVCLSFPFLMPGLAVSQSRQRPANGLVRPQETTLVRPAPTPTVSGLASNELALHQKLDEEIAKHFQSKNLPGIVVLYARDGGTVFKKTLGYSNIQTKRPMTDDAVFRLASISKLVSSVICFKLYSQGKFPLEAPTKQCLPGLPSHHTHLISQLLSCRGGVRHYGEPKSPKSPTGNWAGKEYNSATTASKQFWHDPSFSDVGKVHYSTFGHTFVDACLENSRKKNIRTIIREELSVPYGLATLRAEDIDDPHANQVAPYVNKSGFNSPIQPDRCEWKIGGGGMVCSAEDLLKFGILLGDAKILSKNSLNAMMTPPDTQSKYAFGCKYYFEYGQNILAKSGGQPGASTYIWVAPGQRKAMVVLVNRQDGGASSLGTKLRKIVLKP